MKKIVLILFVLSASFTQAQKNKKAVQLADKLSKVMELPKEDNSKILKLILERNKNKAKLRKQFGDDKEGFKVEAKKVEKQYNKDLKALVGKEKWALLVKYRKEQRALKKN